MPDDEITAELTSEDLATAEEPPREICRVAFAAKTDLGCVRENNEDKFDWWEPDAPDVLARRGRLYAVADGMGGHAAGQIASEIALKELGATYFAPGRASARDALARAFVAANRRVFEIATTVPSRAGMGCTMVALALRGTEAIIAWAGDSRAYRIRDGRAERLTEDHSWVMDQVRAGVLTQEEAERSAYRNVITRSIGTEAAMRPDVVTTRVGAGEDLVLCSDGLTGPLSEPDIADVVSSHTPSFACGELIARANAAGGPDNITVAILRILEVEAADDGGDDPPVNGEVREKPRKRGLFRRG